MSRLFEKLAAEGHGGVKFWTGFQNFDPKTDKVIFIFDPMDDKMNISALGPPALGWPDVTLDFCPGSRG